MKSLFCIIIYIICILKFSYSQVTWQQTLYSSAVPVNQILANGEGSLFIATNGDGILRSQDYGDTWTNLNTGITDLMIKSIGCKNDSILFAGTKNHVVYVSTTNPALWTPFDMNGTGTVITSFCAMPNGEIYAGQAADGIFKTTDNGQSWQEVGLCCAGVLSIAANSMGTIFAGTNAGGVFRSLNGSSWDSVSNGLGNLKINALALNNSNDLFAGTDSGVYRSYDSGNNWTAICYGLTNLSITDISVKANGHIFVSTNGDGVYISKDNGNSWNAVNTGLSTLNINHIAMDSTGYLYAASADNLLFRSGVPYTEIKDQQMSKISLRNYPNPFYTYTDIEFETYERVLCQLNIYDISGNKLQTIVNGQIDAGSHKYKWDATAFSPGIYLCEIITGKEISRIFLTFVK